MKTDAQLKTDVSNELQWDPAINAAHVGVLARDGVVTLTGHLDTYAEKCAIERAVQRVQGVRAVAVELDVKLAPGHQRSDSEIAEAAKSAMQWNVMIPSDGVRVSVEKGWVSLSGELDWDFQRRAAEKAVRALTGVIGVSNKISLRTPVAPADMGHRIRAALTRHAEREAKRIDVSVFGSTVTLRGEVDSWAERSTVQDAAWAAPGVNVVINELTVLPR